LAIPKTAVLVGQEHQVALAGRPGRARASWSKHQGESP